jgi:hypothetical protein
MIAPMFRVAATYGSVFSSPLGLIYASIYAGSTPSYCRSLGEGQSGFRLVLPENN